MGRGRQRSAQKLPAHSRVCPAAPPVPAHLPAWSPGTGVKDREAFGGAPPGNSQHTGGWKHPPDHNLPLKQPGQVWGFSTLLLIQQGRPGCPQCLSSPVPRGPRRGAAHCWLHASPKAEGFPLQESNVTAEGERPLSAIWFPLRAL